MAEKQMLDLGVKIDKDLIEANVTRLVATSIVDALGDTEKLVKDAVTKILNDYVDRDGKPVPKGNYRAMPWLNYIAEKVVKQTVQSEMERVIRENEDKFKDALKKEMSKPKTREMFAARFVAAMLGAAEDTWKMPVTVEFERPKDY